MNQEVENNITDLTLIEEESSESDVIIETGHWLFEKLPIKKEWADDALKWLEKNYVKVRKRIVKSPIYKDIAKTQKRLGIVNILLLNLVFIAYEAGLHGAISAEGWWNVFLDKEFLYTRQMWFSIGWVFSREVWPIVKAFIKMVLEIVGIFLAIILAVKLVRRLYFEGKKFFKELKDEKITSENEKLEEANFQGLVQEEKKEQLRN